MVKPDFKIVRINETEYWQITDGDPIKEIWGIYLVEFSTNTYCCEITPSLWLEYIDTDIIFSDAATERDRDRIYMEYLDVDNSEHSHYMHRSRVVDGEKIKIRDVDWIDSSWLDEYNLEDRESYNQMLVDAFDAVREDGCYW